ncbi:alpha-mannosidase [Amphibacillus jilinensis]|uniref:alpha-mannosidase n=1 Tax=Amphibacillus jilinensis TaxID=1216008 RepID=UPI0002D9DD3F|nr:alpha-mannosidase [Amphibacillus jilinensis]
MFFTINKLNNRIQEINTYRYRDIKPIESWRFTEDKEANVGQYPIGETAETVTVKLGDHWKGRDLYAWLSQTVSVPKAWENQRIVGLFDFGQTGGGNNSGFESLLFVNDQLYQGVDSNHKEVFFKDMAGEVLKLDFRLWSGLEGGGTPREQEFQFKQAAIAYLDHQVDQLYFDAWTAIETIKTLDDHAPVKQQLTRALNDALKQVNWLNKGSDAFYDSLYDAQGLLEKRLQDIGKQSDVVYRSVGHTHIDVAWLWQLKHTREKSARSFSTVLRLMEAYPEYLFLQSQPQLYEYIKEDYPELYQEIRERIEEGRWETDGGMWLESDCNIPSGESLVRQIMLGKRFLKNEFGKDSTFLWLPDVFGYSWALPQILKKSGIDSFMTTKISWSQYNRMPHDTFKWRGIDGSEILTHFITTIEPWPESRYYTYNGYLEPKVLQETWKEYKDKPLNNELLLSYGYGDGGGGVNRAMLEIQRSMGKMPGLPHIKPSRAKDFFDQLHKTVDESDEYVHTWDGELYLEFHRGTYTSQAYMKKMNRKLELLYRDTEWLNVWRVIERNQYDRYPNAQLTKGWKTILRNQFHDIIPGSSIKEVYQDAKAEYEEAEIIALTSLKDAQNDLLEKNAQAYTIYNSSSFVRDALVDIYDEHEPSGYWTDQNNALLDAQYSEGKWVVHAEDIPIFGTKTIAFHKGKSPIDEAAAFGVDKQSLSTPFYDIAWDETGQLIKIFDKMANRSVLKENEKGNTLQIFEDKPLMFDAWDIDIFYQEKGEVVTDLRSVEVVESTDLRIIISFTWHYNKSVITQRMVAYKHDRRLDFETDVDWQERQRFLKVAFPVNVRHREATYDIQFGNVTRPTHWNTSWDWARFETVGHQWADLSDAGYGVSLINDSKYGYDIKDHVMRLSLLKGATYPDPDSDLGEHTFTYSLYPHEGDWRQGQTVFTAWELNNPLVATKGLASAKCNQLFEVHNDHIMVDAVKKAEDRAAIIIRIHEFEGKCGSIAIKSPYVFKSYQEVNLMEEPIGEWHEEESIKDVIDPYEIKTYQVFF